MNYKDVLSFWFELTPPEKWWEKDDKFDEIIRKKFLEMHDKAIQSELSCWRECAEGALAEIIVLDQFSRNIYRNKPESFAFDGMALALAQEAIRRKLNQELEPKKRAFMYLPFMHSESLMIHETALEFFSETGLEHNLSFEKEHISIIKKFGRYPHRNQILGRPSTHKELSFLKQHKGF